MAGDARVCSTTGMTLHPQIVELLAAMDRPGRPKLHEMEIGDARKVYAALPRFLGDLGHAVDTDDRIIPGPQGEIPIRVYSPNDESGRPLVVFYHGGGFCIGDLDSHDRECQAISSQSGAVVVAVDYRMGPEHAYTAGDEHPAWIDDAWAAFTWAGDHADDLGGDTAKMAVCGDSAGGNISAVMAQMARDADRPLALQVLVYPATDVRPEAEDLYPSYAENAEAPILERPVLDFFKAQSRPDGDASSPFMSPGLTEDLAGLAPALILTAEHDPLRDDGEAYADKLRAAGVEVDLQRFDGMPHGFFNFGPPIEAAATAVSNVAAAIKGL